MPRVHDPGRKRRGGGGTKGMTGDPRGFYHRSNDKDKPYWPDFEFPGKEEEKQGVEQQPQPQAEDNSKTEKSDAREKLLKRIKAKKKKRLSRDNFLDDQEFSLSKTKSSSKNNDDNNNNKPAASSLTPKVAANNSPKKQQELPLVTPASTTTAFQQQLTAELPKSLPTGSSSKKAAVEEETGGGGQPTASQESTWMSPYRHSPMRQKHRQPKQQGPLMTTTMQHDKHSQDREPIMGAAAAEPENPVQELWKTTHDNTQSPTKKHVHYSKSNVTSSTPQQQEHSAALQKLQVECAEKDKAIEELQAQQARQEKQHQAAMEETQTRLRFRLEQDLHYRQEQIRLLKQEVDSTKEEFDTATRANYNEKIGYELQIQELKQMIVDLSNGQREEQDGKERQEQELDSTQKALEAAQTQILQQQRHIVAMERRQSNWEQRERALLQRETAAGIAHPFPSQTTWWGQQQQPSTSMSQPNGENLRILNLLRGASSREEAQSFSAPSPPQQQFHSNTNSQLQLNANHHHQQHRQQQQQQQQQQIQDLYTPTSTVGGSPPLVSYDMSDLTFDSSSKVTISPNAAGRGGSQSAKARPLQFTNHNQKRELKRKMPSFDFAGLGINVASGQKRSKKARVSKKISMEAPP